jgi:hypothetical protein
MLLPERAVPPTLLEETPTPSGLNAETPVVVLLTEMPEPVPLLIEIRLFSLTTI